MNKINTEALKHFHATAQASPEKDVVDGFESAHGVKLTGPFDESEHVKTRIGEIHASLSEEEKAGYDFLLGTEKTEFTNRERANALMAVTLVSLFF